MRVVSLVPSLTQTLFDLGLSTDEVVGRTPWCIHPAGKVDQVMVIGGTKTPNLDKIRRLKPDLIVMDKPSKVKGLKFLLAMSPPQLMFPIC